LTFFISSISGRRQWSRKSVQLQLNCAILCLDSDIRKGHVASVCLQADKARVGIDARRIPSNRIGRAAPEPSRYLAVKTNNVVLIVHLDFVAVPSLRREILIVLVILLPLARAR